MSNRIATALLAAWIGVVHTAAIGADGTVSATAGTAGGGEPTGTQVMMTARSGPVK